MTSQEINFVFVLEDYRPIVTRQDVLVPSDTSIIHRHGVHDDFYESQFMQRPLAVSPEEELDQIIKTVQASELPSQDQLTLCGSPEFSIIVEGINKVASGIESVVHTAKVS